MNRHKERKGVYCVSIITVYILIKINYREVTSENETITFLFITI